MKKIILMTCLLLSALNSSHGMDENKTNSEEQHINSLKNDHEFLTEAFLQLGDSVDPEKAIQLFKNFEYWTQKDVFQKLTENWVKTVPTDKVSSLISEDPVKKVCNDRNDSSYRRIDENRIGHSFMLITPNGIIIMESMRNNNNGPIHRSINEYVQFLIEEKILARQSDSSGILPRNQQHHGFMSMLFAISMLDTLMELQHPGRSVPNGENNSLNENSEDESPSEE